jgi:hypothetical protein
MSVPWLVPVKGLVCSGDANHGPWLATWRQPWWGVLGVQGLAIGEGAVVGRKLGGCVGATVGSVVGSALADLVRVAGVEVGTAQGLWVGLKVSWVVHALLRVHVLVGVPVLWMVAVPSKGGCSCWLQLCHCPRCPHHRQGPGMGCYCMCGIGGQTACVV